MGLVRLVELVMTMLSAGFGGSVAAAAVVAVSMATVLIADCSVR